MAIYFGNLDRQLADRQNVIREDADRQYRGSRDTMRAFSDLGSTVSSEIRRYGDKKREDNLMDYKIQRQTELDDIQSETNEMNKQEHNSRQLDHKLKNILVMQKMAEDEQSSRYWKNRDKKLIKESWVSATKLMSEDVGTADPAKRIIKYGSLYGKDAVNAVQNYLSLKEDFDKSDGIFTTDDTKKEDVENALAKLSTFSPLSFHRYTVDNSLVDISALKVNPRKHTNNLMYAALRDHGYDLPNVDDLYKNNKGNFLKVSNEGAGEVEGESDKNIKNTLSTLSKAEPKQTSFLQEPSSKTKDKKEYKGFSKENKIMESLRKKVEKDGFYHNFGKKSYDPEKALDLFGVNLFKPPPAPVDWPGKDEFIIDEIVKNEGHGINNKGHAYYDGRNPSPDGNYNKDGGESLVLAGGLDVHGWMKGKSKDEKKSLADRIFGDDSEGHKSFMKYLNMGKEFHNVYFKKPEQRADLKITRDQQKTLTKEMNKDFISTLIKNHPYLEDFSNFPAHLQVFLADVSFNMGPNWLKKFTKFEKQLKGWVEGGRDPARVSFMIQEFKDSEHYRKTMGSNRTQANVKRLEQLRG